MMRLTFSLRALMATVFVVAVVLGVAVRWAMIAGRIDRARERFARTQAEFDAGLIPWMDLCAESFLLWEREQLQWFSGDAPLERHLARLEQLEERARGIAASGLYEDEQSHERAEQMAERIGELRLRCASWGNE